MERYKKKVENYAESNASFPNKLFALMVNEDGKTVRWIPHGFAFKISDQEAFLQKVIPKYFRHTKLTSFQRQLNLYGFRRILKGEDEGAYFHPKFQRGKKDLISDIQRLPAKQSLMSLQDVMDSYNQHTSFPLESSKQKKKATSPPLGERTRGRMKATSSSEPPEELAQGTMRVSTELSTVVVTRTKRKPKRDLQQSSDSAFSALVPRLVVPRTSRNSTKSNPRPPSPSPQSSSSATDGESSAGDPRRRALYGSSSKLKLHTDYGKEVDSPLLFPTSPCNSTHVAKYGPHDDYLDLSLTSPLFSAADMMDTTPLLAATLPSPTAFAVATAQVDFGSALMGAHRTVDFAGLSNQQDLTWNHNYSSGLPLVTDFSPRCGPASARDRAASIPANPTHHAPMQVPLNHTSRSVHSAHTSNDSSGSNAGVGTWLSVEPRDAFDDLLDFFDPTASQLDAAVEANREAPVTCVP